MKAGCGMRDDWDDWIEIPGGALPEDINELITIKAQTMGLKVGPPEETVRIAPDLMKRVEQEARRNRRTVREQLIDDIRKMCTQ